MKVLVVDDNKNITDMLSECLTIQKHECIAVNDGRNAIDLIRESLFDIVFLDLAMPEFSGYDVIETLDENNLLAKQKVAIFTSSDVSKEESDKLHGKGILVLRKPMQIPEIIELLNDK